MKGRVFAILILLALLIPDVPCQQLEPTKKAELEDVVITLERGECFGTCPVYSVSIHGDGAVVYHGKEFVLVKGKRSYNIPREDVRKLVDEFYKIDYFSLKDEYSKVVNADGSVTMVTDLPGTTTSIKIGARSKSIYNYFGGPEALKVLEHKIDEISQSARYVRGV